MPGLSPSAVVEQTEAAWATIEREPLPSDLAALLDERAARHGERPLWVSIDDGEILSYREFAARTRRCAAALAHFGIGPGSHVAVMLPSVPALPIAWFALATLGAVMVAINTRFTAREIDYALKRSGAEALVIDREYLSVLTQLDGPAAPLPRSRIIVHGAPVDGFRNQWNAMLAAAPTEAVAGREADRDRLLTIQFTSGSTGFPKGCMLSHRYWLTMGLVRSRQGPPVRRVLIDLPFHYVGGQWRFVMTLFLEATAFVTAQPSVSRLLQRLADYDIEFCSVSNAMANLPDGPPPHALGRGWVTTAGLNRTLHAELERRLGAPVRELYGMTEIGSGLSMPIAAAHMTGSGSCGLPVAFRKYRIVDTAGRDVGKGEAGELWVKGPGILQGYFGQPEADAEAFRDGWFRTGDLFRRDDDGYFYMLGRLKDVIRRSGENISPSEVEAAVLAMPGIVEAAAVPVPDGLRGEEVKIYVVLAPPLSQAEVPPDRIAAFCAERLAKFKLPRYIEYRDALPRTASDKIAKQELRQIRPDLHAGSYDTTLGKWL